MVVKVFLWKACHNDLPTRANLLLKKMLDLWNCVVVGDVLNVYCRKVRKVLDLIESLSNLLDHNEFAMVAVFYIQMFVESGNGTISRLSNWQKWVGD